MTKITWPTTLPKPTVEGYVIQPSEGVLRTQMDSGLARQRRIFTQTPTALNLRWIMTEAQFQTFEGWYLHFAQEGAAQFAIDLVSGQGITSHTARFLGQFRANLISQKLWQVTAQLEVINRPAVGKDYLVVALASDLDVLYGGIDRFAAVTRIFATQTSSIGISS